MTLRKLTWWIFSTLVIGTLLSMILGFALQVYPFEHWLFLLLAGSTNAAVAGLGFFSYLIFNWLGTGFLRNPKLFVWVQIGLIVLAVGSVIYSFATQYSGSDLWMFLSAILVIVIVSVIVASRKSKLTGKKTFIPALFFMIVATVLESLPWIQPKVETDVTLASIYLTVITLLVCNAWQILNLHKWIKKPQPQPKTTNQAISKGKEVVEQKDSPQPKQATSSAKTNSKPKKKKKKKKK
jgi:KinB signaling pathway activation protein